MWLLQTSKRSRVGPLEDVESVDEGLCELAIRGGCGLPRKEDENEPFLNVCIKVHRSDPAPTYVSSQFLDTPTVISSKFVEMT